MQQQEQDTARKIVPLTIDKAVWKNLGPARGMGGLYSHIEGFRTGTQLLHVYAYEAQAIAAVPDMIRALLSIEQMARGTTIGRMARAALNGAFISQECFGPQQGCQTGQPDNTDVTPLLDIVEYFAANGVETAPQFCTNLYPEILLALEGGKLPFGLDGENYVPPAGIFVQHSANHHSHSVEQGGAA